MKRRYWISCFAVMVSFGAAAAEKSPGVKFSRKAEAGRHLVRIAGCNDCHTPMYGMKGGNVPEKDWLIGDQIGFNGPWGTTFPTNLRKLAQAIPNERAFVAYIRNKTYRPPMPGPSLVAMRDDELRSLYAYLREMGDAGEVAPPYVAPGERSTFPQIVFVPQMPDPASAAAGSH